jgi:aldose 1-epimerase
MIAAVTQDEDVSIQYKKTEGGEGEGSARVRVLTLSLNGVSVQLSSLGASILRVLVPSRLGGCDDVVMGYKSLQHMWDLRNPAYLNVIVGRVANRIRSGKLMIDGHSYELDRNDEPNHLHGGFDGFSHRIWEASIIYDNDGHPSAQFSLASDDGDQKYPGSIQVTSTYTLLPTPAHRLGARLRLRLEAKLVGDTPTPVNLSQHSYFNLHRHDSPSGCLDHRLTIFAEEYTPVDETSITTREVRKLADDRTMDFSSSRLVMDALAEYAVAKAGRSTEDAKFAVDSSSRIAPDTNTEGPSSPRSGTPYGFDHNYVVRNGGGGGSEDLPLVAVLEHAASGRRLKVLSDAPGVQLYTANYLDGVSLPPDACKDAAVYAQWQGICLETQVSVCRVQYC